MQSIEPNSTILVLNSSYEPLNFTSWKRAIVLLFKEKAQLISKKVIRLVNFIKVPFSCQRISRPSRNMILQRDNFECQYCGTKHNLTLDHIIPRSKGGKDTWENLVTCCETCNVKKGNKDLKDCGMTLNSIPKEPYSKVMMILENTKNDEWKEFVFC